MYHGRRTDQRSPAGSTEMKRLAAASAVGTTLEWYDFTIYNIMAALVFNAVFFPQYDPLTGTLLAFSTYAVGYISRPAGGLVFGHLGDRLGRRFVLYATLMLMGIATCLIGLLPAYRSWGLWSPAMLVLLRFVQGAAIGGEWAGAVLLSLEHGTSEQRGRNGSFAQLGPACGTILGTATVAGIAMVLAPANFENWGWRIPFALSLVLVVFGLWLRHGVAETPAFTALRSRHGTARAPISEVMRRQLRGLFTSIGARAGPDVFYALLVVFTLTYVTTILHLPRMQALAATSIGAACSAACMPLFGSLSDRVGRRPLISIGALLSAGWAFAYFRLLDTRQPLLIDTAVAVGMVLHASMYGPQAAFIAEQFPTRIRYAGSSLAYTLTGIVAGGLAPLLFTALLRSYGSTLAPSLYLTAALAVTLVAMAVARETARVPLRDN
jgi:MFS family permease